jgi:hypothetical protein
MVGLFWVVDDTIGKAPLLLGNAEQYTNTSVPWAGFESFSEVTRGHWDRQKCRTVVTCQTSHRDGRNEWWTRDTHTYILEPSLSFLMHRKLAKN